MKLAVWIAAAVVATVGIWSYCVKAFGVSQIEYRGETYKLRKSYLTYEGYRSDSPNLAIGEPERIEGRITLAKIGTHFPGWASFAGSAFELKFPGYGAGGWPLPSTSSDLRFAGAFVEIPQTGRWRYFVLKISENESLELIDDFVERENIIVAQISVSSGLMSYTDQTGRVFRTNRLRQ